MGQVLENDLYISIAGSNVFKEVNIELFVELEDREHSIQLCGVVIRL